MAGNNLTRRISAMEAEGADLFKGAAKIAGGVLAVSFLTTELPFPIKIILSAAGIVLCLAGVKSLKKYAQDEKKFKDFVPQWDKSRGIFDVFAKELNQWYEKELLPRECDGDIAYFLKLQKERLEKKGLKMHKMIVPSKGTGYGTGCRSRKTLWYTTDMMYEHVSGNLSFSNQMGPVYEQDLEMTMYEIVAHTPDDTKTAQIRITCPNCGAVNSVQKLEEGCPYCGTMFQIRDLFPRVINSFFIKTKSIASNKKIFTQSMVFAMACVFVIGLVMNFIQGGRTLPGILFSCYVGTLIGGGFLGYIIADIRLLAGLFDRDGMKRLSLLQWLGSKKKITNTMLHYDRNFSFDKFEGQMVSLLRMAVMAENPGQLACYCAGEREKTFSDILEMTYTNGITLRDIRMEGERMHLSLRTWWINYYEENGKIKKSGDCIDVTFVKNREYPKVCVNLQTDVR